MRTFPKKKMSYWFVVPVAAGGLVVSGAVVGVSDDGAQPTMPTANANSTIRVNSLFIVGVKMDESGQRTREFFNFFSNARFAKFPP